MLHVNRHALFLILSWALVLGLDAFAADKDSAKTEATPNELAVWKVKATDDFEVTGDASRSVWSQVDWVTIPLRSENRLQYVSRAKLLHSQTGLYVLFDATDSKLSVSELKDFDNLWEEDVFEVFLWTDEKHPIYFEYEISPLGAELPIIVPNFDGKFLGWRPWHYDGNRKIRKATKVTGGEKKPGAVVTNWTAEFFIPYELLKPLQNVPPQPGSKWRANFYRMDYDDKNTTRWSWMPVGRSFHEYEKFGTLLFE